MCIYIFEKSFNLLKTDGRIGMVCKLQVTEGKQHSKFEEWRKGKVSTIIDYGDSSFFHDGAQTAILIGKKTLSTSPINIINKNPFPSIEFEHEKISKYFYISQGWQSAANKIYKRYAKDNPNDKIVMSVAPGKKNTTFFGVDKKILEKIAVVIGNNVPQKFLKWFSKENKKELKIG